MSCGLPCWFGATTGIGGQFPGTGGASGPIATFASFQQAICECWNPNAEMRAAGVHRVLIYCSDYKCNHSTAIRLTRGLITSGSPMCKHGSYAKPAARKAPTSERTLIGTRAPPPEGAVVERWSTPLGHST